MKSTGLETTPLNKHIAQSIANELIKKIKNNEFQYAKEFPGSSLKMKEYYLDKGVYRFHEFKKLLNTIDIHYKPHIETLMLTGLMFSELAKVRKDNITNNILQIRSTVFRMGGSCNRDIPITKKMVKCLSLLYNRVMQKIRMSFK